jgi:hypothetical protein
MKRFEILVPGRFPECEIQAGGRVQGFIAWELKRGGKVIRDSGGFHPNLITNQGMNGQSNDTFDNMTSLMNVGTGSTAPAFTQTALAAEVGTGRVGRVGSVLYTYTAGTPDYWFRKHVYTFLEAFANGNLTEVATFNGSGIMFMRQLLKDGSGNPTTITKTSLDQLTITYEYRWYPMPAPDIVTTLTLDGVVYTITTRAHSVENVFQGQVLAQSLRSVIGAFALETNALVARNGNQAVGTVSSDNTQTAYVTDSFTHENKCIWDTGVANFATGIGMITHCCLDSSGGSGSHMFQSSFSPKIPKTNIKKLTMFIRRSWARFP